jgi:ABC-type antimicrobial peptide transport system permease subunit
MFAFLSPIIVLTIILTVYAANLVRKKRDRQLTILTERGTNRTEIGSYLALESLITGFISLIFGVFLGLPLAALLTKSSGFLTFTSTFVPLQLEVTSVTVALIGSVGAIILIQLFNTATLLKKRNIEDYGRVEKTLPTFYKYYVDLMLIAFGVIIWFIYRLPALGAYQERTAKYVGIPSIVLVLFGLILFVQRLLPLYARGLTRTMSGVGKFTSKIYPRLEKFPKPIRGFMKRIADIRLDIPSLSVREIYRYQKSFARSSIILCLSFSLVVSSIAVPASYQNFNTDGAYYDLGADIVIRNFPIENTPLKYSVGNLTEVESISVVRFVNLKDVQGDLAITYSVLAIDPETYIKTAFFREDFSVETLTSLISHLNGTNDVLGQVDELGVIGQDVGDNMQITYRAYNDSFRAEPPIGSPFKDLNITINIAEKYKYWPNLVNEILISGASSLFYHFVVKPSFMNYIQVAPFEVINYLYVKVAEGYVLSEVADKIETLTGGMVTDVDSQIFVKPGSPRSSILYSAINSTLLMSFAINAIILALFASIQLIDKSKEIATMKAIGISSKQLIKFHLTVYLSLLAFSTIFGLIIGYVTSSMLMSVLTFTRNIPPYSIFFPLAEIFIVLAILLVAAIIGATIPTITSAKQEIGTELRQSA